MRVERVQSIRRRARAAGWVGGRMSSAVIAREQTDGEQRRGVTLYSLTRAGSVSFVPPTIGAADAPQQPVQAARWPFPT